MTLNRWKVTLSMMTRYYTTRIDLETKHYHNNNGFLFFNVSADADGSLFRKTCSEVMVHPSVFISHHNSGATCRYTFYFEEAMVHEF